MNQLAIPPLVTSSPSSSALSVFGPDRSSQASKVRAISPVISSRSISFHQESGWDAVEVPVAVFLGLDIEIYSSKRAGSQGVVVDPESIIVDMSIENREI